MRRNDSPVIDGDGDVTERSKEILEFLGGDDHIFFASDYPRERRRAQYLEDIPAIEAANVSDAAKRRILADNARRFYRLIHK